jgi:hypothetical protein
MKKEISVLIYEINKGYNSWKGNINYRDMLLLNKFINHKTIKRRINNNNFGIELTYIQWVNKR